MKVLRLLVSICTLAAVAPIPIQGQNRIIAPDSTFALTIPDGYHPMQINAVAALQFADTISDSYVLALTESKEDLYGWNLARHSTITFAQIVASTDFPEISGPTPDTIGILPAIQHEMEGVSQGTRVVFLHTSIETPVAFVQILVWSARSRWAETEEKLRGLVSSFESLSAGPELGAPDIFDIVPGEWAWDSREAGCSAGTQTFSISEDRTEMTITHSEPFERADGTTASITNYVIEGSSPGVLHTYITDESRVTDEGDPAKWDLVLVARNRLAWHRTDWQEGSLTGTLEPCPQT